MRFSVVDTRGIHQRSMAEPRSIQLSSRVDPRSMDNCSDCANLVTVLILSIQSSITGEAAECGSNALPTAFWEAVCDQHMWGKEWKADAATLARQSERHVGHSAFKRQFAM